MSFATGKGGQLYVNGNPIHDILRNFTVNVSVDSHDSTTFQYDSHNFIPGLKNATMSAEGLVDNDLSNTLDSLRGVNNTVWTMIPVGGAGSVGVGMVAIETQLDVTAPVDDIVTLSITAQSNVSGEAIISIHGTNPETGSGNGSIVDNSAATTNGGSAYIQAISLDAGTLDVSIHHSTDNFGASDDELVAFAQITSTPTAERVTFTGTVRRYVRVVFTLAGGAASAQFHVGIGRG